MPNISFFLMNNDTELSRISLDTRFLFYNKEFLFVLITVPVSLKRETGVDQTRRHCSVEMIRGIGPSELG